MVIDTALLKGHLGWCNDSQGKLASLHERVRFSLGAPFMRLVLHLSKKLRKLLPPCLTLSNIRYVSRVKWSNPGKGVALSPTPRCCSYWKGSFMVALKLRSPVLLTTFKASSIDKNEHSVLVLFGYMAYQPSKVIKCQILYRLYIYHHHHHVVPPARISLTISRHLSLSFIASGRSSGLHPVSSHSCCM